MFKRAWEFQDTTDTEVREPPGDNALLKTPRDRGGRVSFDGFSESLVDGVFVDAAPFRESGRVPTEGDLFFTVGLNLCDGNPVFADRPIHTLDEALSQRGGPEDSSQLLETRFGDDGLLVLIFARVDLASAPIRCRSVSWIHDPSAWRNVCRAFRD